MEKYGDGGREGGMEQCCDVEVVYTGHQYFLLRRFYGKFGTGARCDVRPGVLSQGRRGPSLATCLLRQNGGGASSVEIPCNEL